MDAGPDRPGDTYWSGLDIGARVDPSALVTVRRRWVPDPGRPGRLLPEFLLRGARRFPLGALYHEVSAEVARIFARPPLAGSVLGFDRSGVGDGVVEILRGMNPRAAIRTVVITAGQGATQDGTHYTISKVQLVGAVTAALEGGRLLIPDNVPHGDLLLKEMMAFKAKVTATGHEQLEALREGVDRDDLAVALCIAVWLGSQQSVGRPAAYGGAPAFGRPAGPPPHGGEPPGRLPNPFARPPGGMPGEGW